MHIVLMMPLLEQKRTWNPDTIEGVTSLVPKNDLDKSLLQSSQVDHGYGVDKPGEAGQVSPVL